eukprot:ctg_1573.g513
MLRGCVCSPKAQRVSSPHWARREIEQLSGDSGGGVSDGGDTPLRAAVGGQALAPERFLQHRAQVREGIETGLAAGVAVARQAHTAER